MVFSVLFSHFYGFIKTKSFVCIFEKIEYYDLLIIKGFGKSTYLMI